LVVSVAEQWLALPASYGMVERRFTDSSLDGIETAQMLAARACDRIQLSFPDWQVRAEADSGSPARIVIEKAGRWPADLVVVGSHGRSALGRFVLGSVSQRVVTGTVCSVRIARGRLGEDKTPVRVVIGIDGSPGAEAAVRAVSTRKWPRGSEARLISAQYAIPPMVAARMVGPIAAWVEEEREKLREMQETSTKELRSARLVVSSVVKESDPKKLLCDEAEKWGADSIFVGARGMDRVDRFLLGSVSAAVAARAHCSVEVVRGAVRE
jgi:nucleotide-binding universal stress UspA family protein